jgi:hypothetical protein
LQRFGKVAPSLSNVQISVMGRTQNDGVLQNIFPALSQRYQVVDFYKEFAGIIFKGRAGAIVHLTSAARQLFSQGNDHRITVVNSNRLRTT